MAQKPARTTAMLLFIAVVIAGLGLAGCSGGLAECSGSQTGPEQARCDLKAALEAAQPR